MHCFFHLTSVDEVIRDDAGIEVRDVAAAWTQASLAVNEFCAEECIDDGGTWEGWTLEVSDRSGTLLFSMPVQPRHSARYEPSQARRGQMPTMRQ